MADGHWEMLQTNLQPTPDSEFIFLMLLYQSILLLLQEGAQDLD